MIKWAMISVGLAVGISACAGLGFLRPDQTGIAWGPGSFDTLGEQIYFTSLDNDGDRIPYSGGPATGMMMGGYLSCASCHGPDARGGLHRMHMDSMDAPDIRWSSLSGEGHNEDDHDGSEGHADEYDLETFRRAVVEGEHPDGDPLSRDMPRWDLSSESLKALQEYLISLD